MAKLKGIEDRVWLQAKGYDAVFGIADEDLQRTNEDKTSAVHFIRFEFDEPTREALLSGAPLTAGIDHANCRYQVVVPARTRDSLIADLS